MFESINPPRIPRRQQIVTAVVSTLAHLTIVALAAAVPLLYFTEPLPQPPDMLAFVAASPPPPPPPPPGLGATEGATGETQGGFQTRSGKCFDGRTGPGAGNDCARTAAPFTRARVCRRR